jgi:hypothetical protein
MRGGKIAQTAFKSMKTISYLDLGLSICGIFFCTSAKAINMPTDTKDLQHIVEVHLKEKFDELMQGKTSDGMALIGELEDLAVQVQQYTLNPQVTKRHLGVNIPALVNSWFEGRITVSDQQGVVKDNSFQSFSYDFPAFIIDAYERDESYGNPHYAWPSETFPCGIRFEREKIFKSGIGIGFRIKSDTYGRYLQKLINEIGKSVISFNSSNGIGSDDLHDVRLHSSSGQPDSIERLGLVASGCIYPILLKFAFDSASYDLTPTKFYKEVALAQNLEIVASQIAAEDSLIWRGIESDVGSFSLNYTTKLFEKFFSVKFGFVLKRNKTSPYLEECKDPKQYYLYQVVLEPDRRGQLKVIEAAKNAYKLRDTDPQIAKSLAKSLNALGYSDLGQKFSDLADTQTLDGLDKFEDLINALNENEQESQFLSSKVAELLSTKYRRFTVNSPILGIRCYLDSWRISDPILFISPNNTWSFSEVAPNYDKRAGYESGFDVFYSDNNKVIINYLGGGVFTASSDDLARHASMEMGFIDAVRRIVSVRSSIGQEDKRLKDASDVFNSGRSGDQAAIQRPQPPVDLSQSVLPKQTFYSVTNLAQDDTLNVRSGPGVSYDLVARLPNSFSGLRILGEPILNGMTEWVQIVFDNKTGWVVKSYLKQE